MSASRPSVLVLGDLMLDADLLCHSPRISAEGPFPIVKHGSTAYHLGGASNVAANIQAMGANAYLIGVVGSDYAGHKIQELANHAGITSRIAIGSGTTTVKNRVWADGTRLLRYDQEGTAISGPGLDETLRSLPEFLTTHRPGAIVLVDYDKGFFHRELPQFLINLANQQRIPVLVEARPSKAALYRGATIYKPNFAEAKALAESFATSHFGLAAACGEEAAYWAAKTIQETLSIPTVVVTRGEEDVVYVSGPIQGREGVDKISNSDVVGAGDVFMAGLAERSARGAPLCQMVANAAVAATLSVKKRGTAVITHAEIIRYCYDNGLPYAKIAPGLDAAALFRKTLTGTVVLTNGCFDGLHAGHLELLREAKKLGGMLIVACNDDASLQALKGPNRPLVPLQTRLEHLASVSDVDLVLTFSGNVEDLIRELNPDVLVKGEDALTRGPVPGADLMAQLRRRVVFVPIFGNFHSSLTNPALPPAGHVL